MKLLVTGGAGYVGSTLVPLALGQGHQVRVLDTLEFGSSGLESCLHHPRLELMRGDVRDAAHVRAALAGVDAVVHLAALVGYPACRRDVRTAVTTNVEGTRLLLELRHPDQAFLFASTGSVYGSVPEGLCTELTDNAPLTLYGESKSIGEKLVGEAGNAAIFRYATAFGVSPMMRLDLLPNHFSYQALRSRKIVMYESGARRSFIHVADIARSFIFALERWESFRDETFNVGDERLNATKKEIALQIRQSFDFELTMRDDERDPDRRDYEVSYRKIRELGFTAEVGLASGIKEIVAALRGVANLRGMETDRVRLKPGGVGNPAERPAHQETGDGRVELGNTGGTDIESPDDRLPSPL
ncbi:NAD-dependent epimerase/dehydratase family protein [Streptomyces sp. NPDC006692]|uniref:NAD-dependent epimerase/dehydratase family protein n=1 Tax=Streptomyces sp. NPDC006692 TaxID=3364758 RepID=UPI0036A1B3A4